MVNELLNIQEDKEQFQKEQDTLLKTVLSTRFFRTWTGFRDPTDVPRGHVELYITSQCNQKCEYCYLVKYPDLYPKEFLDPTLIKDNLKIFYDWVLANGFVIPQIEFYTGEIWHSKFGTDILDITLEYLANGMQVRQFMIPSNCSFLKNYKQATLIQNYIERFKYVGSNLVFSISIDGKIVDNDIRPNVNPKITHTDEFYDMAFSFSKRNGFGFHPMVAAASIDLWPENYKWWKSMLKKYNMTLGEVMMLEVRNDDWTDEKIESFLRFEEVLIQDLLARNDNDPIKAGIFAFGVNQTYLDKTLEPIEDHEMSAYAPYHLSETDEFLGCTLQNTLTIRLGDLAICPCHRTAYNKNLYGWFVVEDGQITDIKANNPQQAIRNFFVNNHVGTLGCDACPYNKYCMGGCPGQQMEKFSDPYHLDPSVCKFLKAKVKFLIKRYHDLGFLDWLKENITPYHVYYPNVQNLLKLYENVMEEEAYERVAESR